MVDFKRFVALGVGPDHLFSQVYPIHDASVETENIKIDPAGAGCYDQGIDAFFADVFFKHGNAVLAAKKRMRLGSFACFFDRSAQAVNVQGISDSATCADINAIFFIHG